MRDYSHEDCLGNKEDTHHGLSEIKLKFDKSTYIAGISLHEIKKKSVMLKHEISQDNRNNQWGEDVQWQWWFDNKKKKIIN